MGAQGKIAVAQIQADGTTTAAETTGKYDWKIAQENTKAMIEAERIRSEKEIKVAELNYKAVLAQNETDLKISFNETDVEKQRIAADLENTRLVQYTNALANLTSAEAEKDKNDANMYKYELQYGDNSYDSSGHYLG